MSDDQKVLLIYGSEEPAEILSNNLKARGFAVDVALGRQQAAEMAQKHGYELFLIDIGPTSPKALETLTMLHESHMDTPILVMSSLNDAEMTTEAIKRGAFDWIPKPIDIEKLAATVDSLITRKGFLVEPASLDGGLREEPGFKKIVGDSDRIRNVFSSIETVRASDVPVLLLGETGTGKDLVAKAIHYRGTRRKHPLIAVNCAAIPDTLLESELFGHVRGAFTGAERDRAGRFEEADRGTIFLDEISEMSPGTQAKMLRVIEEKKFERVGGNEPIHVDVRIISATNTDIGKAVADGRFRRDLYYRLAVFPIVLPPLRERRNDIPEVALYFLQRTTARTGKRVLGISDEAMRILQNYDWPGNVRQLQNCISRAVLLARGNEITPKEIDLSDVEGAAVLQPDDDVGQLINTLQRGDVAPLEQVEETLIRLALAKSNGNITAAADRLGISRSTIYRKIKAMEER